MKLSMAERSAHNENDRTPVCASIGWWMPAVAKRTPAFGCWTNKGKYRAATVDEGGIYRSTVIPGFWLKLSWLWGEERLSPLLLFAEIVGLPAEVMRMLRKSQTNPAIDK